MNQDPQRKRLAELIALAILEQNMLENIQNWKILYFGESNKMTIELSLTPPYFFDEDFTSVLKIESDLNSAWDVACAIDFLEKNLKTLS